MQPRKLSVLMPVYDEIATIAAMLDIVAAALPGVAKEVVIVDDGSRDGTREWLAVRFPAVPPGAAPHRLTPDCEVRVIFHAANLGKGGAIRTALAAATGEVFVVQDADLEYDPADWAVMYDLIVAKGVADVVYGSRFYGKPHRSLYYHHFLANRTISILFNLLYNQTLTDIEACYKMFTREVRDSLRLTANDFGFEVEISAQIALGRRWRIYEVGIHYYGRTYHEGKKIGWRDGVKALWYVVRYRFASGGGRLPAP